MHPLKISLARLHAGEDRDASSWVRRYYEEDDLVFNARVEAGIVDLLRHPEWGSFFRILADGYPVGYIVLTFGFDHEVGGRLGTITDFYVELAHRSKGVGAAALDLIIDVAKDLGLKEVSLVVLDHNTRVLPLYHRKGFEAESGRSWMCLQMEP